MPQCSGDSLTMEKTLYASSSSTAHELFVTSTSKLLILCIVFECTWTGYSHFIANSFKHWFLHAHVCVCVIPIVSHQQITFLNKQEREVENIWKTKRMWVFSIITILVILNHMLSKINWECRHMGFWIVAKSSGYGIILLTTNTKNHESPVKTSKQTPEYCQPCKFHPHHKWDNYSQEISRMRLTKPNHVTCYTNFCTNSGLILPHMIMSRLGWEDLVGYGRESLGRLYCC